MLPRLLAAYRKYGSPAARWPVAVNHFWSSGALVETTKKGSPTATVSTPRSHGMGLPWLGGIHPGGTPMGRIRRGARSTAAWTASWRRGPSHAVVAWAYPYPARSA